jgi:hypothetical protein
VISNQCPLPVVFCGSVGVVALRVTVPEASSMPQVHCPKYYTYYEVHITWFLLGFAKHIHILFGA